MKKLLLISAMLLIWAGSSWGQVATGYTFSQASGTYTELEGATTFSINGGGGTLDDGYSATQTIPFNFAFGGTSFNTYRVNSNGWLGFGAPTTTGNYSALAGTVNNLIAFVNRDFNNVGATYSNITEGVAPNRIHKIQAKNFYRYNTASMTGNAQVWFYEGSNVIEFRYGPFATTWTAGTTVQVGLRGSGTGDVRSLSGTGATTWTNPSVGTSSTATMQLALTVIPASGLIYTWTPLSFTPPTNFVAQAVSSSQINLSWNLNLDNNPVLIASNTVNTFGTPSGSYNVGDPITGGGTVIYMGTGTSFPHTGLAQNQDYFYRAWSYNLSNEYTSAASASAKTFCALVTEPFTQDFEAATFPPACWSLVAGSGNWNRQTGVSAYGIGNASARANFYNINGTNPFDLITVGFDLPLASLSFDHAYATYTAGENDQLFIFYSIDEGASFNQLALLNGGFAGELVTAPPISTSFVPTASQWATKTYILPEGTNKIKFQAKSAWGNNLYIDNIKIDELPTTPQFSITPSSWDFGGTAAQGVPATKVFTVKNEGGGLLVITDINITPVIAAPNEFTLVNPPASIELGLFESTTLTVAFSPNSPGERSATLNLNSNARVQQTVELSGTGVDVTGDVLYVQDPTYTGTAINSTYLPPAYYEGADNFWGLDSDISRVAFYGIFNGSAATTEPFYIRFYGYAEGYVPGLAAPVTGEYKLALKDSYSDGWSANYPTNTIFHTVSLYLNGNLIHNNVTLPTGTGPVYFPFSANVGDEITTVFTINGTYASECYYAILDPNDNIIAEQGGTWASPGTSVPGDILPGSIQPLEPDWENPVSAQYVYASLLPVGTTFVGYPVYKLIADLHVPVAMTEGWFSAQFDAVNGTPVFFYWLPGLNGDNISHHRIITGGRSYSRTEVDPSFISSKEGEGGARDKRNDDRAFELLGPSILIPLSGWALYLGIFLITVFMIIRFRRMI